jgi:hypothetical protein
MKGWGCIAYLLTGSPVRPARYGRLATLGCLMLLWFAAGPVWANEEIVSFQSRIEVRTNATVTVVETIRVRAEQQLIQHGIMREYVTDYWDRAKRHYRVDLAVQSVTHDGRPEPFTVQSLGNSLRLRIGREETIIAPREHEYEITYSVRDAIKSVPGRDEFFWNVTGDQWPFLIRTAQAQVRLPPAMPRGQIQSQLYTSPFSWGGAAAETGMSAESDLLFRVTDPLPSGRGLAVHVSWPTGYLQLSSSLVLSPPGDFGGRMTTAAVVLLLGYMFLVRCVLGNPTPQSAVDSTFAARAEPLDGVSAATCRFIWRKDYDDKCLATALVDLAVKGAIRISELKPGRFQIHNLCQDRPPKVPLTEGVLFSQLLGQRSCVTLEGFNGVAIEQSKDSFTKALRDECEGRYVMRNRAWAVPPILLVLGCATLIVLTSPERVAAAIALVLTGALATALRMPFPGVLRSVRSVPFRWLVPFLVIVGTCAGLFFLCTGTDRGRSIMSPLAFLSFVALVVLTRTIYQRVRRLTPSGQELRHQLVNLRAFLAGQAQAPDSSDMAADPPRWTEFLPYALALDAELVWAERAKQAVSDRAGNATPEQTAWYRAKFTDDPDHVVRNVGVIASALSLAGTVLATQAPSYGSVAETDNSGDGSGGGGGGGGGW